jgi:glucose/arabinose dehydrogenase
MPTHWEVQLFFNYGPLGGNELNVLIKAGNNGWPLFSYGLNYDMARVSEMTEEEAAKTTILPVKYGKPDFQHSTHLIWHFYF